MNLLASLKRPEYIFRPTQILRRVICELSRAPTGYETVRLPWGLPIRVRPNETIGSCIRRLGIHDLASSEFISRLVDPGDVVVDVGANIGHMVSLMALRAGPNGKVIAIEPHPLIFGELQYNIAAWKQVREVAPIVAHNLALTNFAGVAELIVPHDFDTNRGLSFLANGNGQSGSQGTSYQVPVNTLDAVVGELERISFLKIDVEGHELAVLKGAQGLLGSGRIRDILFEEEQPLPTPVTGFLEDQGYTIFRLDCNLFAPTMSPLRAPSSGVVDDAPNYLATRDPDRTMTRMSKRGWMVYSRTWN